MNIQQIFENTKTIAIVGLSDNSARPSYGVAAYLMKHFEVIPVNPNCDQVLGLKCYPNLESVPQAIDMVDVFQRSERVAALIEPALSLNIKCFWMQLGVFHAEARSRLTAAGITVIEDRCTKIDHAQLC